MEESKNSSTPKYPWCYTLNKHSKTNENSSTLKVWDFPAIFFGRILLDHLIQSESTFSKYTLSSYENDFPNSYLSPTKYGTLESEYATLKKLSEMFFENVVTKSLKYQLPYINDTDLFEAFKYKPYKTGIIDNNTPKSNKSYGENDFSFFRHYLGDYNNLYRTTRIYRAVRDILNSNKDLLNKPLYLIEFKDIKLSFYLYPLFFAVLQGLNVKKRLLNIRRDTLITQEDNRKSFFDFFLCEENKFKNHLTHCNDAPVVDALSKAYSQFIDFYFPEKILIFINAYYIDCPDSFFKKNAEDLNDIFWKLINCYKDSNSWYDEVFVNQYLSLPDSMTSLSPLIANMQKKNPFSPSDSSTIRMWYNNFSSIYEEYLEQVDQEAVIHEICKDMYNNLEYCT